MNDKDFQKSGIDLSPLGFLPCKAKSDYFCTPRGATVIGTAGVDGIHFCTVKRFAEMIFAVSPMNAQNDYVHPIAKNFEDFLSLLLAVGNTAALEQAHLWCRAEFDAFVAANPPSDEAKQVLSKIAETFSIAPMKQPYEYVKGIQDVFDYFAIPYRADYEEWCPLPRKKPEWKVTFSALRKEGEKQPRAGKEICVNHRFLWEGETWFVPSVYLCTEGLVADICVMVEPKKISDFQAKQAADAKRYSDAETHEKMMRENPMALDFRVMAHVNGKTLREKCGMGLSWMPLSMLLKGEKNEDEALWHLEHYELDKEMGWIFRRISFPWATAKKPKIKTLSLDFSIAPTHFPSAHLTVCKAGERFSFLHPISGEEYTLTVTAFSKGELPRPVSHGDWEYPSYFCTTEYTISPAISSANFYLRDQEPGDPPRWKKTENGRFLPEVHGDCAVMIIGGADGPMAVFPSATHTASHATASSLHFEPREKTDFLAIFCVKMREDITVTLFEKEEIL